MVYVYEGLKKVKIYNHSIYRKIRLTFQNPISLPQLRYVTVAVVVIMAYWTIFNAIPNFFFQLYKNVIPSHSVYVPAVEKTIHKLRHPTREELEQDVIYQQEMSLKQQLAQQQMQLQLVL